MENNNRLKWLLLLPLLALASRASAEDTAPAGEEARMNVLFLAIDDLNDWVSHLGGHPQGATPHIDALAARGVTFTRAYCNAPSCNPSRTALLTGIPPHESGVYVNRDNWRRALPDVVTLPAHFKAHGYRTLGSGKIFHHIGRNNDTQAWHDYFRWEGVRFRNLNGLNKRQFDWGLATQDLESMHDYRAVSWAIDQLEAAPEGPLFLAVGIYRPHLPWYVPQEYFERFPLDEITLPSVQENDLDDIPAIGRRLAHFNQDHQSVVESNQWAMATQAYLASIAFADDQVGRLMEALDASPMAENTIIVLWSDHGWHLGEKEHWRKFTLWEESCRVPMAIVVPGHTPSGSECARTVSLSSIYPTLCDLCLLPTPEQISGPSMLSLLADPQASWEHPALTTQEEGNHSLRTERWRYTRYRDGSEELYDHDADPFEWNNLADDAAYDEIKTELHNQLPEP